VFFPRDTANRPAGYGVATDPNWFYYWKQDNVCGIPSSCVFTNADTFGSANYAGNFIRLGRFAPTVNKVYTFHARTDGPLLPAGTYPPITAGAEGKGIQSVAETIQHELEHLNIYRQFRSTPALLAQYPDGDNDWIPDSQEATYGGVSTATNRPDTYQLSETLQTSQYARSGDRELRCRLAETNQTVIVYPAKDWANPGCQHKNQHGPQVTP